MRGVVYIVFSISLVLGGCSNQQNGQANGAQGLFSLQDFIDHHVAATDSIVKVGKSITVDGVVESKTLEAYDIHRDIQDFDLLDINKAALWDKYVADTISQDGRQKIIYEAIEDKMNIRSFSIELQDQEVQLISISKYASTFLADVKTRYAWNPGSGYTITKEEDRLFADPTTHVIKVEILE